MSKLNNIQEQITALGKEAQRISECHQRIGEYILNLHERGLIADGELNVAIANIINEVNARSERMVGYDASGLSSI
jgi:hypothetical protein